MKKAAVMFCLLSAVALAADKTVSLPRSGSATAGKPAPWFSGWTPDNRPLNLTKLLKEPGVTKIALVFFATWCVPCKRGLDMLKSRRADLSKAGVKVVLVDYMEENEKVAPFIEKEGLGLFEVVLDRFGEAARSYGVSTIGPDGKENVALPMTFVIGPDGALSAIFSEEGDDYVERLFAGK